MNVKHIIDTVKENYKIIVYDDDYEIYLGSKKKLKNKYISDFMNRIQHILERVEMRWFLWDEDDEMLHAEGNFYDLRCEGWAKYSLEGFENNISDLKNFLEENCETSDFAKKYLFTGSINEFTKITMLRVFLNYVTPNINFMYYLRDLSIHGPEIEEIPEEIYELDRLRYFRIGECPKIMKIPNLPKTLYGIEFFKVGTDHPFPENIQDLLFLKTIEIIQPGVRFPDEISNLPHLLSIMTHVDNYVPDGIDTIRI